MPTFFRKGKHLFEKTCLPFFKELGGALKALAETLFRGVYPGGLSG